MAEGIYRYCTKCRGPNFTAYPQCRECRNAGKKPKKPAAPQPTQPPLLNALEELPPSPAEGLVWDADMDARR
jgi:hypothetical protein